MPVPAFELVVFGASGDLAMRKLFPALFHRYCDNQIPHNSKIIGVGRHNYSREEFLETVKKGYIELAHGESDNPKIQEFMQLVDYVALDATTIDSNWEGLKNALSDGTDSEKTRVFYLSTPPAVYTQICDCLQKAGLVTDKSRVVIEKPIGRDLKSAKAINDGVGAVFPEDRVYRIDHYLGKETVQNLLVLRFANSLFEPLWSRANIDHIQITVAEDIGVGSRGSYYDKSGAMRDMVQNHLLQLLCLVAMEAPSSMQADAIRNEKIKVLQSLEPIGKDSVKSHTVRGQYKAGLVGDKPVPSYLQELSDSMGQNMLSNTETFVAIEANINNWRWAGVPFYLRTGKRLPKRQSEIVVKFRPPPLRLFEGAQSLNALVLRLQPDEGMEMWLSIKEPGPGKLKIKSLPLNLSYNETFLSYPDAYERLLMDVVRGNLSLFMRREEVEAAWQWVDRIIEAWESEDVKPHLYVAGSDGPLAAALMLDRDGREWKELS